MGGRDAARNKPCPDARLREGKGGTEKEGEVQGEGETGEREGEVQGEQK